ncbi:MULTISPECIES: endonuclease domain-containing protein [Microbacterium]|uniref:endonuclease domain-containing protein n=1 Tax=Microbacterium TaxID=33882 RepID=UPI00277DD228|nr:MULTISPECIES: DUF559 domain-containing protein [Microbacterium]MDQ1077435.1 very-short-patch-repair endonuclease [Microbacterium sp. SORGH_AS_0969]MDQ1117679.1 very-short-patch-repair endonuclease [Microbacterium testaceum]
MRTSTAVDLVARAGGVMRRAHLLAHGATVADIRRFVRGDTLERLREGVLALPDADPIVKAAAVHGGSVACASALRCLGVWLWDDEARLHVWLGTSGRRHPHAGSRCVTHHDAGTSAFGVVSIVQALVQVASCLGDEVFFAAFESAWRKGLIDRAQRAEVRAGLRAGQRRLVDLARPDADSGLESILRLRLSRLGIRLESQVRLPGVGVVDFLLDGRIILETDGRANHDGVVMRHKDLRRDAIAAAQGFETLRFDYALVLHEWHLVEAAILARRAQARGGPHA